MTTELSTAITAKDLSNLDFKQVYEKAVEIFSEQALLNKKPSEVTLKDIELSRAKASNFLEAISGVLEIGHQVEILSAEQNKFKRGYELTILQKLLKSCDMQASFVEKNLTIIQERLDALFKNDDADPEQIALLQSIMNSSIDASQKIIASMARLVQLERMSGSRPWGREKSQQTNIAMINALEPQSEKPKEAPRKLTAEDLEQYE